MFCIYHFLFFMLLTVFELSSFLIYNRFISRQKKLYFILNSLRDHYRLSTIHINLLRLAEAEVKHSKQNLTKIPCKVMEK